VRVSRREIALARREKVERLGINRDRDYMYYIKDGAAWRIQRKQPGIPKGRPEKVADGSFQMDTDYIYFVDSAGDVSRERRKSPNRKRTVRTLGSAPTRRLLNQPRSFKEERIGLKISPFARVADPVQTAELMERASNGHRDILSGLAKRLKSLRWVAVEEIAGAVDLWATAPDGKRVIFEAKTATAASEGSQVRSAVGQLLEYRYVHGKPDDLLALVTNRRIGKARIAFLRSLDISALFLTAGRVGSEDLVPSTLKSFRKTRQSRRT
jgi:hypothetical protein